MVISGVLDPLAASNKSSQCDSERSEFERPDFYPSAAQTPSCGRKQKRCSSATSTTSSRRCKRAQPTGASVPLSISRQVSQAIATDEVEKCINSLAYQPPIRIKRWRERVSPRARDDDSLDGSTAVRVGIVEELHVRVLARFQSGRTFCCKSPGDRSRPDDGHKQ
jgi:hypothetical protein